MDGQMYYVPGNALAPQGLFGNILGGLAPQLGQAIGGAFGQPGLGQQIGGLAGQFSHLLPFAAAPQLAPQGLFGNILGGLAPQLGQAIGGAFGQPGLGQQIGGLAGQFSHLLPFAAAPQLAPQGLFGNILGGLAPQLGQAIGGAFGQPGLGQQIGGLAGQFSHLLPFAAAPQLAPQGLFGNILGGLAPQLGQAIGGAFGQPGLGQQIGGLAGQFSHLLPFAAAPQLAPQGLFGNILGGLAPQLGQAIGGAFGQPGLGQQIGGLAGQFSHLLPFAAAPQLAPQGLFGNILGGLAPQLGQAIGGAFGQPGLGQQIGGLAGQFSHLLPFAAAPQLAPQGLFGNILGGLAPQLGQAIGGAFGQPGLGQQIGGLAGQFSHLLPFAAAPQLAPQGLFGNILGGLAPQLGQAIGGAFGQPGLGQQIGGFAGQLGHLLPFAAGPQLAPQGLFGGLLGSIAGGAGGSALGHLLGNQALGHTIGQTAGGVLGGILPFAAAPQLAPLYYGIGQA